MSEVTTKELQEFRAEISAWVKENKPAEPDFLLPLTFMEVGTEQQLDFLREWQRTIYDAGYLGMAWPKEYGGHSMDPKFQAIADQTFRAHRCPITFNWVGLGWAGPLINHMGTEAEKQKHLKGILTAEDIWCQGFSEPDHGSDLGSAQTRAVRDGDEYVINGQKIWTTHGNYAKYMILVARTNPEAKRKYDGLSFFLAPMNTPGIEARPIRKLTGEYGFTETFFTDARIPADCLMGEEGQGWKIAMQTLQFERGAEAGAAGGVATVSNTVDDMVNEIKGIQRDGESVLKDPLVRDELVKLIMSQKALALQTRRSMIKPLTMDYPGSLMLGRKLTNTEHGRAMRKFAVNMMGAQGGLYVGDEDVLSGGFWQRAYLNSLGATIGGGTSQVQTNILGEKVLGLPK
ncbi:acyl-CoA dehydrogenase [Maricurvus nonylphenolicus]|uniref:acyl-CoA dehydrogenase family protein n=1 Tax=Maricurvus nonylphenolicus TaxID=1008307 RepID=UPI0036F1D3F5